MGRYEPAKGREHDADLVVIACFLSLPIVALLYAVLCFAVALGAFCVQSTDVHGKILLMAVLAVACSSGIGTVIFFWHAWRGAPTSEVSEEDTTATLEYGWRKMTRETLAKGRGLFHRQVKKLRRTKKHSRTDR